MIKELDCVWPTPAPSREGNYY